MTSRRVNCHLKWSKLRLNMPWTYINIVNIVTCGIVLMNILCLPLFIQNTLNLYSTSMYRQLSRLYTSRAGTIISTVQSLVVFVGIEFFLISATVSFSVLVPGSWVAVKVSFWGIMTFSWTGT